MTRGRELKDWFHGAQDREFFRPQRPEYILPRMALTMADPHHPDALLWCCHQYVAAGMRDHMDKLEPTDTIIHFGMGETVFHTILVRGDDVLIDRAVNKEYIGFDPETRTYTTTRGVEEALHEITVAEFTAQYLDNVSISVPEDDQPEAGSTPSGSTSPHSRPSQP